MIRLLAFTAFLGLLLPAAQPHAQAGATATAAEDLLIRVDVTGVAAELATELGTTAELLPRSIEVSVGTAAKVCKLAVDQLELLAAAEHNIECNAVSVSPELADAAAEALAR